MIFRKKLAVSAALAIAWMGGAFGVERIGSHFWPTPNDAFVKGRSLSHFAQPTQSGRLESALWGCVRNNGTRFHEGIDLRALRKDSRGEAADSIYAFDAGVIRYVNRDPRKSSYGRYIVIEHPQWMPGMVTLYAHLSSVPTRIAAGVKVKGGESIAIMGRSASYAIPREQAHLHFEVGLWLGPDFQKWYDRQPFKTPNDHGAYNGMNIIGLDVWALLQSLKSGESRSVLEYVLSHRPAVSVTIWDDGIPDLLRVNPNLLASEVLPKGHAGWRIDFAASGVPLRFEPLTASMAPKDRETTLVTLDPAAAKAQPCLSLVRPGLIGGPSPKLASILNRLFVD